MAAYVPDNLFVSWYENTTSSVKPEVHSVLQRHQKSTEPWPQATCTKMLWIILAAWFSSYAGGWVDRQAYRGTDRIRIAILKSIWECQGNKWRLVGRFCRFRP